VRFGDAPVPVGRPELAVDDEFLGWEARPSQRKYGDGRTARRAHGAAAAGRPIALAELVRGQVEGRTSRDQITYSERGNLQGAQLFALAGKVEPGISRLPI
jgi:alanine dehydrogenase